MRHLTIAELPRMAQEQSVVYNLSLIFGGSLLLALCAQICIPLPFTTVPITGQTFGVLVLGALLGSRRGTAAVLLYLAEGAAGLPVFAGFTGGAAIFSLSTAGYLAGFVPAVALTGFLAERGWDRTHRGTILAMSLGTAVIFLFGCGYLAYWFDGNVALALQQGCYPFLPGAVIKIALAAAVLPLGWRLLKRNDRDAEESA